MNKILVVAKNRETYFIKRLSEEVGMWRLSLFNPWGEEVLPEDIELAIARTTGVYGDQRDLILLNDLKVPLINPLSVLQIFRSKSNQYAFFEEHAFPCLSWKPLREQEAPSSNVLIKPDIGQGGWGIKVITPELWPMWISSQKDFSYIVQPYLENCVEWRVFFIENFLVTLKRKGTGVAANFRQSGEAVMAELPSIIEDEVRRLIQVSGANYGGIDILQNEQGFYFLELNAVPGIEQLEQVSRINIMAKLTAKYFCQII